MLKNKPDLAYTMDPLFIFALGQFTLKGHSMFPWKSVIQLKENSSKPAYLQIADAIIKEIHEGHLSPGQKLPGARVFSALLNLNRKTIVAAMDELSSQGWIESRPQAGTFVSSKLPESELKMLGSKDLSQNMRVVAKGVNALRSLEPLYLDFKDKRLIDEGVPDVTLAPLKLLFMHERSLLSKKAFAGLMKYNHVEGDIDLRNTLKVYLNNTRGIVAGTKNIFITRGSQMGIYIALATLLEKGDTCITSFPGYRIVDSMIPHLGGKVEHVHVDQEGLVIDEVEKICKRKKIKLLYVTPHHHYPTTVTLSPERRIKLLKLALKYNFYILEDDYDYDFHYENKPVLPLASLNKTGHVVYIGSFSKCLAPSIRIGYFVASNEIMTAANKLRRIMDRQGDPLLERAMSEFIKSGDLQRHLKKVVKVYKHRRDYFCSLLQQHLSSHVSFTKPEGGMSVWMVFKKKRSLRNLPERLSENGYILDTDILFIQHFNAIRVGFASLSEKEMEKFVVTLGEILAE